MLTIRLSVDFFYPLPSPLMGGLQNLGGEASSWKPCPPSMGGGGMWVRYVSGEYPPCDFLTCDFLTREGIIEAVKLNGSFAPRSGTRFLKFKKFPLNKEI